MTKAELRAEEEAVDWRLRLRDAGVDDWLRFTSWLEADVANATAYDAIARADAEAAELLQRQPFATRTAPRPTAAVREAGWGRPRRLAWYAAALSVAAAAAVAAVFLPSLVRTESSAIITAPGEHRSVTLADGSRIDMNGSTRVEWKKEKPRSVDLAFGQASFTVRHDPDEPFEVIAGASRLFDLGTAFDVIHDRGSVDISVASGAVLYNPGRENIQLNPGDALHDPAGSEPSARTRIDPAMVGQWRSGSLVFANSNLAQVAAGIARTTGLPIIVNPAIASRSFDGVIVTSGDREAVIARLGPLLGVAVRRGRSTIELVPHSEGGR